MPVQPCSPGRSPLPVTVTVVFVGGRSGWGSLLNARFAYAPKLVLVDVAVLFFLVSLLTHGGPVTSMYLKRMLFNITD